MNGFVTLYIGHLRTIGLLRYADLLHIDKFIRFANVTNNLIEDFFKN